eukprot:g9515.t1
MSIGRGLAHPRTEAAGRSALLVFREAAADTPPRRAVAATLVGGFLGQRRTLAKKRRTEASTFLSPKAGANIRGKILWVASKHLAALIQDMARWGVHANDASPWPERGSRHAHVLAAMPLAGDMTPSDASGAPAKEAEQSRGRRGRKVSAAEPADGGPGAKSAASVGSP